MNKWVIIFFIVAFNIIPIFGVIFYKWQPFDAFWFFWVETLIMAFFNCIRIIFSQNQTANNIYSNHPFQLNIIKGLKYLLIRFGIFLFYALFIIVFIGFLANNSENKMTVLTTLFFQNKFFNLGLVLSVISQSYYLIFYFFRTGTYVTARPDAYTALFDSRQLIMHLAVVLGTFGSIFLIKNTSFGNLSAVFIISLLCLGKCVAEIYTYKAAAEISYV